MEKTVLIAGKLSRLGEDLFNRYIKSGANVAVAVESGSGLESPPEETEGKYSFISWNRRSPISSRSLLLECRNLFNGIDEAYICFIPENENAPFHELSYADIERLVDDGIKSYLFLIKECLNYFQKKKEGVLNLVYYDQGSEVLSPLDAQLASAFQGLAESLFTFYQNEAVTVRGYSSSVPDAADFSSYLFEQSDGRQTKAKPRWNKFTGKSGLFPFSR